MRRILVSSLLLLAGAAFFLFAGGASEEAQKPRYWVEMDNAFGLIEGGDLKIAGVRAGKITDLKLNKDNNRALVQFQVNDTGFGSLRSDVFCESRPQSLIGEYFIDCLPGTSRTELKPGTRIPVSRTGSTVGPDLVNDIMRRPYRERLRIIISELGAGVGGNAQNLNDAIRRANPALRETDRVLAILARQNRVLGDLAKNADVLLEDLTANRKDVSRWIVEAGDAAEISATRRDDIAAGFRRLPGFLEELGPTMAALGDVATEQTPALRDLNASADQLERFFSQLRPFSEASRPAFRALGEASEAGDEAVRAARETVRLLNRFAQGNPELAKNLAIILEHLDDREHAVEEDPDSPTGKGYTGLEALLSYIFDQVLAINAFDSNNHILKVSVIESPCAEYADAQTVKDNPELEKQCSATLGPNQPGVNYPDPHPVPYDTEGADRDRRDARNGSRSSSSRRPGRQGAGDILTRALSAAPSLSGAPARSGAPVRRAARLGPRTRLQLLDYLLAP
jgi:ABC-type transporter Mla subunit MlaD